MAEAISKDMMINDIITSHPYLAEYIMDFGVHCVGCGASAYETLEEGFMGHGMSDEEVDDVIVQLNKIILENDKESGNAESGTQELFKITEAAAKRVTEFATKEGKPDANFRIRVVKGGCSGHQYMFGFDENSKTDDMVFAEHGVKILIDKESIEFLKHSVLDYHDSLGGSGFTLENPNVTKSCGCGNSFG
jgi:iron-sulfur cluster assembly protein